MRNRWKDQDITKALQGLEEPAKGGFGAQRVWMKIEDRLLERRRPLFGIVWKPWGHPIRWVAAAACLMVAFTVVLNNRANQENRELSAYLENISNPIANISHDQNMVKVSTLLTEPSSSAPEISDEVHVESMAADEIFL